MSDYILMDGELYHYGVPGMKWGVMRSRHKYEEMDRLRRRAAKYDRKSALMTKKSEKAHAEKDLEDSNRKAIKAAKYDAKAAKLERKAAKEDSTFKSLSLGRKAERLKYKATRARIDANSISKTSGYGRKAMKYSIKSDIAAKKAARARKKLANNKYYIAKMNRKFSSLSQEELNGAYAFVNDWLNEH